MKIVDYERPGGPNVLRIKKVPKPTVGSHEIMIQVAAAGLNVYGTWRRRDIPFYRYGFSAYLGYECLGKVIAVGSDVFKFKEGDERQVIMPEIKDNEVMIKVCAVGVNWGDIIDVVTSHDGLCPGLECSGIIEAVERNVIGWKVGERVCAILEGGGYAEKVAVPANFLLPLPDDINLDDAAGLPYATCSIWLTLFKMRDPKTLEDKKILIREGTSGIGSLAIQYAKYMGLKVIASTGSRKKFSSCRRYGADICVKHTSRDFVQDVEVKTRYSGVDFVIDYGESDLQRNIECCCSRGKVVIVDLHGRERKRFDLGRLQKKQAEIKVFDLRSRDLDDKASVIAEVRAHLWPAVLQKKVVPAVKDHLPMIKAQKALNLLKKNESIGKIILCVSFERASGVLKS